MYVRLIIRRKLRQFFHNIKDYIHTNTINYIVIHINALNFFSCKCIAQGGLVERTLLRASHLELDKKQTNILFYSIKDICTPIM